jgi:hypothetical protein
MKIHRTLFAIGLVVTPLLLNASSPALAGEAVTENRTVTIGVPDMH